MKEQLKQNKNTIAELTKLQNKKKSHTVGSNSVNFNYPYITTIERLKKNNEELKQQLKQNKLMGGTRSRGKLSRSKRSRSKRSRGTRSRGKRSRSKRSRGKRSRGTRSRKHKKYKN
jgi:hypothetical protein